MVLLENFGAEPFTVKLQQPNCGKFVGFLLGCVSQPMMPGIPKFRKESHPERAKGEKRPIFHVCWEMRLKGDRPGVSLKQEF